ncbi:hypothetical protein PENTCL1PPCAC_15418 [Pristionchus entomophagus]|uniref:Dehydrogenase n=1 Tax=Pristionchus entomophagus TaxID=358040 RepID=A0AAV5TDH2_9BILA|nr:hypothetical protein PENTCL1PPCAC_15418 [Pristionchus entomophagus]
MLSVLVTGANRGIGLGLVQQFLSDRTVGIVIATVRNIDDAKELTSIDSRKLHVITCEVTDETSVCEAAAKVSEIVDGKGLDILVNNAGIYCPQALKSDITKSVVMEQLEVNVVGPLLMANKLHGLLKQAADLKGSSQIVNISSASGSLELAMENASSPLYDMSKAALNMLTRKLSLEWKADKIRATAITPGWVRTDMGGMDADQSVEESTSKLTKFNLSLTESHTGEFYRHTGEKLPW